MKKLMLILTVSVTALFASSQSKADIEVSYDYCFVNALSSDGSKSTYNYHLLSNGRESKFFSPVSEAIDSLKSTPEGEKVLNDMRRALIDKGDFKNMPRKKGSFYVVKSFPESRIDFYEEIGVGKSVSADSIGNIAWSIEVDSVKNLLGYECVKATADYHGRKWTVWFAPEIPVSDGPWKLHGLPGLILEAVEPSGQHAFFATGVEQTDKMIKPIYGHGDYEKIDRISQMKSKRAFYDNPLGAINAMSAGKVKIVNGDLKTDRNVDFLETDYRKH